MASRRINVFFYGCSWTPAFCARKVLPPINIRAPCVPDFALPIGQRITLIEAARARALQHPDGTNS